MHVRENMMMDKGSIIELPPDLFAAIDNAHAKASAIYNSLDKQALDLIDPNRLKKQEDMKNVATKIKQVSKDNENQTGLGKKRKF